MAVAAVRVKVAGGGFIDHSFPSEIAEETGDRFEGAGAIQTPTGDAFVKVIIPESKASRVADVLFCRDLLGAEQCSLMKERNKCAGPGYLTAACEGLLLPAARHTALAYADELAAEVGGATTPASVFIVWGYKSLRLSPSQENAGVTELTLPSGSTAHMISTPHFSRGVSVDTMQVILGQAEASFVAMENVMQREV
jgi:hypothetical protein